VADAPLGNLALNVPGATEGKGTGTITVATFTDGNAGASTADFTATVTWGDGATSSAGVAALGGGAFAVRAAHTYAEEGTYTLAVAVHDDGGSSVSGSTKIAVADAALGSLSIHNPSATEGIGFSGFTITTFTDANKAALATDFTATVTWGDGSSGAASVVSLGGGSFALVSSHTYADEGTRTLSVQIRDVGGATVGGSLILRIADAALANLSIHSPGAAAGVSTGTFTVAAFHDANTAAPLTDFTAVIAWGDGSTTTVSGSGLVAQGGGNFAVKASHTYSTAGTFTLSVHVADVGGSSVSGSSTVTVAAAGRSAFVLGGSSSDPIARPPAWPPLSSARGGGSSSSSTPQEEQSPSAFLIELYLLDALLGVPLPF
jgi:hypothetical protein